MNEAVGSTASLEIRGNIAERNQGAGIPLNPGSARTFTGIVIDGNALTRNSREGIRIAPSLFPSTVFLRGNAASGNALGPVSLSPTHWTYLSGTAPAPPAAGVRTAPEHAPGSPAGTTGGGP